MSFIDVDDLAALLPDLIADALRTKDTRPVTPSDHITKTSGVVEGIDGFTALVQLDDDRPGHITPVQMAAQVAVGDRPVILVSPNGGMVIVGNGGLSGTGTGGETETGTGLGPGVHIPLGSLDRWQSLPKPARAKLVSAIDSNDTLILPLDPKEFPAPDWPHFDYTAGRTIFPIWIDREQLSVVGGVGHVTLTGMGTAGVFSDISAGAFAKTGGTAPNATGGTGVLLVDTIGSKDPAGGTLVVHVDSANFATVTYTGTTATSFTGVTLQTLVHSGVALFNNNTPTADSHITCLFWTVVRGVAGTTAAAHAANATITGSTIRQVACVGDSITFGFSGEESYVAVRDTHLHDVLPLYIDGWPEHLARGLGSAGLGFRGLFRTDEWSFSAPQNAGGWLNVATLGALSESYTETALDFFPFTATGSGATQTFGGITGNGATHTATWRPEVALTGTVEVVWLDGPTNGDWSYSVNGGAYTTVASSQPSLFTIRRTRVEVTNCASFSTRCADSAGTAGIFTLGGIVAYDESLHDGAVPSRKANLVHNVGKSGSLLHTLARPAVTLPGGTTDPLALFDGQPESLYPDLMVLEFSNDVQFMSHVTGWPGRTQDEVTARFTADLDTVRDRVGRYCDLLLLLMPDQDRSGVGISSAQQDAMRAAAVAWCETNHVAYLDVQEAWAADYSAPTFTDTTALDLMGPAASAVHPTQKGYHDIGNRLVKMLRIVAGGAGTGGKASGPEVLAQFSSSGVVIPTPTSKIWTLTTAGQIGGVILTMGTKPLPGRTCVIDVHLNGVSLWANPAQFPAFGATTANPLVVTPDGGAKTYATLDLLTAYVIDGGSGRDLEVLVVTDAAGSHGDSGGSGGGPPPKTAKWGEFTWDDGTIWA